MRTADDPALPAAADGTVKSQRAGEEWRAVEDGQMGNAIRRRWPRGLVLTVAAVVVGLLVVSGVLVRGLSGGGTDTTAGAAHQLERTSWRLETYSRGSQPVAVTGDHRLEITEGHISFDDGLNESSGSVQVGTGTLHIGDLGSTAAGCDRHVCEPEATVDAVLTGDPSYALSRGGNRLVISRDGKSLVYRRVPAIRDATLAALAGHTWTLRSIDGGRPDAMPAITLAFARHVGGQVFVGQGCDAYGDEIRFDRDTVRLTKQFATTGTPCDKQTTPHDTAGAHTVDHVFAPGTVRMTTAGSQLVVVRGDTTLVFRRSP